MPLYRETPAAEIPVRPLEQLWRHRVRYLVGVVLLGAYQTMQYLFDTRLRDAVDAAMGSRGGLAAELGLALVAIAASSFVVRLLSRVVVFNGGRLAEYELRKALLYHLHRLGPSFYQRVSTGDVMSRATNDLTQVRLLFGFGVLNAINTVFALVSAIAVMVGVSLKLMIASFVVFPMLMMAMRLLARQMFIRQRENQEVLGEMSATVQSSIAGIRLVRSYALEEAEARRFEDSNQDYAGKALALARLRGSMWPIMQGLTSMGLVIVLLYGGHLMLAGEVGSGDFLAFFRALNRLTWPLMSVGFLISIVQRGRAAYARLDEVFRAEPDVRDGSLGLTEPVEGRVEVRELSFSYAERAVLEDVSFVLEPGRSVAVVGRTGSGKSTLAALLVRLHATPRGSVFVDDVDVCDLPLAQLRRVIGYVQQTPFLFSTTVGRNIGYALEDPDAPSSAEIIEGAAREAEIHDEIALLPDGYDTVVGERGVQLSGGQKQRTALARGLVAQPAVLVLDDPLSAVDARTEKAILDAIDRQRSERGVVLITHRVAAASRCDEIVVLDEGRVVERGTHAELEERGGIYAGFAEEQRVERELERLGEEESHAADRIEEPRGVAGREASP